ncbi:tetratricopeptide repeat protein [Persicimonas caeni]|nr:tetratricopeptide repeat protein [Persicimonas caeni]
MLAFAFGCNQNRAKAVTEMNKGIEAYQSGQNITAVKYLKAAKSTDPTFAEPALYLGQLYHRQLSELDNAEQAYREALQRDPENAEIHYKLGAVLSDKSNHEMAAQQYQQAVQKAPNDAKSWFRLGLSQKKLGENAQAVESFMKSIRANARMKMDEEDPGGAAYHALGDLYTAYGFYDKALQVYDNGVLNNGDVARLYAGRGVAQLKLKRFQEAANSFKKALELDPKHVSATFNLAVAHNELGEHDAAIGVLETYLTRSEDQVRRSAAQGLLQTLKSEKEKAATKQAGK